MHIFSNNKQYIFKKLILSIDIYTYIHRREITPELKQPLTTNKKMSQKITQKYPNTEEDAPDSSCKELCIILGGGCTMLGFIVAWICWIIYSIIALANNSNDHIRAICNDSNIWACLLTMVVISLIQFFVVKQNKSQDEDSSPVAACCSLVVSIGLYIWEAIELFNPCAYDSRPTNVYTMLLIHFCFTSIVLGLLIVVGLAYCFLLCCCGEKTQEPAVKKNNALPYQVPKVNTLVTETGENAV